MPKTTPFSKRTGWTLQTNALNDHLERLRSNKIPILDLTESNPTRCDFSYSKNGIVMSLQSEDNLRYDPESRGLLEARVAVCRYYKEKGFDVSEDQVFLTSSTSESYTYLLRLLVNTDEHVLFPQPSYPLFSFLGDLNDVRMDTYPLMFEDQWRIDLDALADALMPDTKAIVFVNPNNPTGSFVRSEELEALNALCRDKNIAFICDEVFTDFSFDQSNEQRSLIGNNDVLTFVLGGISKTLGLPQMKLSWIIVNGPGDLVQEASARLEIIADTYLSVNTPTQNALSTWLTHRNTIQDEMKRRISENYKYLQENVSISDGCDLIASQGGWYAVLKLDGSHTEEEWVLALLTQDNVYVHPGYFFDFDKEAFIVISLLPATDIFQEGVRRIIKRVKGSASEKGLEGQKY